MPLMQKLLADCLHFIFPKHSSRSFPCDCIDWFIAGLAGIVSNTLTSKQMALGAIMIMQSHFWGSRDSSDSFCSASYKSYIVPH